MPRARMAVVGLMAGVIVMSRFSSRNQIRSSMPDPLGRPRLASIADMATILGQSELISFNMSDLRMFVNC